MTGKTINTNNFIALICIIGAIGLMVFLFAESRMDPSLRIAALVSGTGLVSALIAIASTLVVGKDVTKPDPADLPPGSKQVASVETTTQIPPVVK